MNHCPPSPPKTSATFLPLFIDNKRIQSRCPLITTLDCQGARATVTQRRAGLVVVMISHSLAMFTWAQIIGVKNQIRFKMLHKNMPIERFWSDPEGSERNIIPKERVGLCRSLFQTGPCPNPFMSCLGLSSPRTLCSVCTNSCCLCTDTAPERWNIKYVVLKS